MKTYIPYLLSLAASLCGGSALFAQAADVSVPKQRDTAVESAEKLLSSRDTPVAASASYANPFVGKEA